MMEANSNSDEEDLGFKIPKKPEQISKKK